MIIIYFNPITETYIEFFSSSIKNDTFKEDILNIGALHNGSDISELAAKLDESELDDLLFNLQYKKDIALNSFFIKNEEKEFFYLNIPNSLIEEVERLGSNDNMIIVKLTNSKDGIFLASTEFMKKNLIKKDYYGTTY